MRCAGDSLCKEMTTCLWPSIMCLNVIVMTGSGINDLKWLARNARRLLVQHSSHGRVSDSNNIFSQFVCPWRRLAMSLT